MEEWMYKSWNFHQDMYQMLYDRMWDEVDEDDLNEKLVYAFTVCFGDNYYENKDLRKITDKVKLKLLEVSGCSNYKKIGFTFISLKMINDDKQEMTQCLIWTKRTDGKELCIDLNSRTYENWNDFLENNVLPKCFMMYPKYGRYVSHTTLSGTYIQKFIDIKCEKSIACSNTRKVKKVLDIAAGVGSAVACGALILNPVSAPILAGMLITGGYNIGTNVAKLIDISDHEGGLSIKNPNCVIAFGDIVITAAGSVCMGAGSISKQIVTGGNGILPKIFSSGSNVLKIADNVANINRCVSVINLVFNITVVIVKCATKTLKQSDILYFGRILLFGFNLKVSRQLLEDLIKNLADYFIRYDAIDILSSFASRGYEAVKKIQNFCKQYDLKKLTDILFIPSVAIEPILKISPLLQGVIDDVMNAVVEIQSLSKNSKKNKMECLFKIGDKLFKSLLAIRKYYSDCQQNIENFYGERTWKYIQSLVKYDGIDCCSGNSDYDNKINIPNEIDKIVKETLKTCSKYHNCVSYTSTQVESLFSLIVDSLMEHHLKDTKFIINLTNYYCKCFFNIYSSATKLHHFEYFLYLNKDNNTNSRLDKTLFFKYVMKVPGDADTYFFTESLFSFKNNLDVYYKEFNSNYTHDFKCNEQNCKKVWYFDVPNKETLTKKDYYLKAKELIPLLGNSLNEQSTTFKQYFGRMAIIESKVSDTFTLYFYIKNENKNIVGILIQA